MGLFARLAARALRPLIRRSLREQPSTQLPALDAAELPTGCSVAIIMDGNRRWARQRGLPITAGHRAGAKALRRTVEAALQLQISQMTVFAFSTENWQRPETEVGGIMSLFSEMLQQQVPQLHEQQVRVRFMGRRTRISSDLQSRMEWAEALTVDNERMTLVLAFDYGGRAEIVDAVKVAVEREGIEGITEAAITRSLYLEDLHDPDLIIRTSGEQRMSNFLLWQGAYSELLFTPTLWPDFGYDELAAALRSYAARERRYGGRPVVPSAEAVPQ